MKNKNTQIMFTHSEAIDAIVARINADWKNPLLVKIGNWTNDDLKDIKAILRNTQATISQEQPATHFEAESSGIRKLLETINTDPTKRPHFELINHMDEESEDIETGWIPLDRKNARILIDFLINRFPGIV